jgi:lipopolysaccharide/colanic/teichoic acid biosynthesis glycosyltransferase
MTAPRAVPAYAVVVPAYRAAATIGDCVAALRAQTVPGEIVVVDDGSPDDTAARAAAAGARALCVSHGGAAAARNAGWRATDAPIVLFTDADCRPRPDWAERLLTALADPGVSGARGRYATRQRGLVPRFVQAEYEEKYDRLARRAAIDFVDTYAAAYRRSALEAAGGFDERFRRATVEDQDLSFRLVAAGHRLAYAPGAVVEHRHPERLASYVARKFRIGADKAALLRAMPGRWRGDDHTPLGQRLQLAALAPLALGLAAAAWCPARRLAPLGALPFLAASAPFAWRVRRDPVLALAAVPLLLARAASLAAGLAVGTLAGRAARDAAPATLAPAGDPGAIERCLPALLAAGRRVVLAGPGGPTPARPDYRGKRALDLALGGRLALAAAPALPAIALAIRLDSPGPALLAQPRIGRGGAIFGMYKLRTMRADAPLLPGREALRPTPAGAVFDKRPDDPRVTRVGRWLRRTSLDELPQLWNVLRGEMSLVGPRPDLPIEAAGYGPAQWRRLAVRPGLTGPWQVRGRGRPDPAGKLAADLGYADAPTLAGDLRLLVATAAAVLRGDGAY